MLIEMYDTKPSAKPAKEMSAIISVRFFHHCMNFVLLTQATLGAIGSEPLD